MQEVATVLENQNAEMPVATCQEQSLPIITHKTKLATKKEDYLIHNKDTYIAYLNAHAQRINSGEVAVYLSRKVNIGGQNLYFPFIDIDGDKELGLTDKIESAITYTSITYDTFKHLGVADYFHIIATGNAGFRMVSNILLDIDDYRAFVAFLKREMAHIKDLKPTEELEMPHQLFAYKGHGNQKPKNRVDGHSVVIPNQVFEDTAMSSDYYREVTTGKPDPGTVISFMEQFLNFRQISDLTVLDGFGRKLQEYRRIHHDIKISNTFNLPRIKEDFVPLSLEVVQEKLQAKNILCDIEDRGGRKSLSFIGFPCPSCGKTTASAWAAYPHYRLKCFNVNCEAHSDKGGIPLKQWAGFSSRIKQITSVNPQRDELSLRPPTTFEPVGEVRNKIEGVLGDGSNSLILVTAGVGKTHAALKYLAENMIDYGTVLYSCPTKALRDEAHKKVKTFTDNHENIHILESLGDLCRKPAEVEKVIARGFSPKEILCGECRYSLEGNCIYHNQRQAPDPGIYFMTHKMLQYLKGLFPEPDMVDLIVLDENLVDGFLEDEECTEDQMRTLASVLDSLEFSLIDQILQTGHGLVLQVIKEQEPYPVILNGKRLTPYEDTLAGILAVKNETTEHEIIGKIKAVISTLKGFSTDTLYEEGVNLKAIRWLDGLIAKKDLSFQERKHYKEQHSYLVVDKEGKVTYIRKYVVPIEYPCPVKILDATGSKTVAEVFTKRPIQVVRGDVQWNARKIHIRRASGRSTMRMLKDKELTHILTTALSKMTSDKILVITYMFLKPRVLEFCRKIDPSREYMGHHFQGPRGINQYEGCDGVIVLGSPFINLKGGGLVAHILFPKDKEMKESWNDLVMNWEIIQGIHRIRPVRKDNSEIVVISSEWPQLLPDPDEVINQSQHKHWKDLTIQTLYPYVKEFGFLNPDIGYIANVYIKPKEKIAHDFQSKINGLIDIYNDGLKFQGVNCESVHQLTDREDINLGDGDELKLGRLKLIFALENILKAKLTSGNNNLIPRITDLSKQSSDNPISLSNTKQWADIVSYFKEKYPHFESFGIKLPHARGNSVEGVGNKRNVIDFYSQLSQLKIFGDINLQSYQTVGEKTTAVNPIPDNFLVAYIPDCKRSENIIYLGNADNVSRISLDSHLTNFKDSFSEVIENRKIITNNGKELAKRFILSGLDQCEIYDVTLNERIIKNREGFSKVKIQPEYFFRKYGLAQDADTSMLVSQLYQVWEYQQGLIDELNLRDIIDLENSILWITAKLEVTGFAIDKTAMFEYQGGVESNLAEVKGILSRIIPRIPLGNAVKLRDYLNLKFKLNLGKGDRSPLSPVADPKAKAVNKLVSRYWNLGYECNALKRYLQSAGNDGRVHDQINQLGTITGRFSCGLHSVRKAGPMRSFFRAKDGCQLVIADYSMHEPRILFGLSDDKRHIEALKEDQDIYVDLIREITGKSEEECRDFRKIAKEIIFGLIYGESLYSIYGKVKDKIGTSITQDTFCRMIEDNYSEVLTWRDQAVKDSREIAFASTLWGRRLNISSDTKTTTLYNFPVQGTGADVFKLALVDLDLKLRDMDARIVHIIHDEIIMEARSDIAEDMAEIMRESMEGAFRKLLPNVPIRVQPSIRDTWGETVTD